jgi:hypothetical protein
VASLYRRNPDEFNCILTVDPSPIHEINIREDHAGQKPGDAELRGAVRPRYIAQAPRYSDDQEGECREVAFGRSWFENQTSE